jgi:uncharacterized protein (DUF736 family)
MAIIGTFSFYKGKFEGGLHSLTINAKAEIVPSELTGEDAPQWRVMVGRAHVGAGWDRTSTDGRKYVSIKLDDPSFPAPIYANLVEKGDLHELIWSRSPRTTDTKAPKAPRA